VPGAQTVSVGTATSIAGVSLTESGNTSGETFTVVLVDSNGVLSANGGIASNFGHTLTISGPLSQVNADLATLSDTDGAVGSDTITLNASDSFNNSAAAQTIAVTTTGVPPDPHLWASINFPSASTSGVHLFDTGPEVNTINDLVAIDYQSTLNFNPANPSEQITRQIAAFDLLFFPQTIANPIIETVSVIAPSRQTLILPTIQTSNGVGVNAEGIADSVGQANGNEVITQVVVAGGNNNDNTLNITSPTVVDNAGPGVVIYNLHSSFQNTSASIGTPPVTYQILSTYNLAWDQFSSSAQTFSINFLSFNASGTSITPITNPSTGLLLNTPISLSGIASISSAPAWIFNNGAAVSNNMLTASGYLLGVEETNTTTSVPLNLTGPHDELHFQSYNLNGTQSSLTFDIQPDLHLYATGATNQIDQEIVPTLGSSAGGASNPLAYSPYIVSGQIYYAVAWNETVTDVNGTHDQVEYYVYTGGASNSRSAFQIADGNAQNVRLGSVNIGGQVFEVLAYGDNTATHIIEFDANGNVVASIVDPTAQAYDSLTFLGDGRIVIGYDDTIDADNTSQYNFKIFDLRTTGININDSTNTDGKDQLVAGTHYSDTFIGENNVANEYYFVGQNAAVGPAPSDTFTVGQNSADAVIFPDAISNYTISAVQADGSITVTNFGDSLHTGSIKIKGVQTSSGVYFPGELVLEFGPSKDLESGSGGVLEASAGTLYVASPPGNPVIIDNGATAEFGVANNSTNDAVSTSFVDTGGTLKLDAAALGSNFTGAIILDAKQTGASLFDFLDLTNTSVSSASIAGTTLTVNLTGGGTQIYTVIGQNTASGPAVPFTSDGANGTILKLTPVGSLWDSITYPAQPNSGTHLYGAFTTTPEGSSNGEFLGVLYGVTTSGYTDGGSDTVTDFLLAADPFGLPYQSSVTANGVTGEQVPGSQTTIPGGDFPQNSRQLALASTSATQTQGIGFFVTENAGGTAAVNQFTFNEPTAGLNSPFTITTSSSPIESNLIGANLRLFASIENNSSGLFTGTGNGAAYGLAYGQYNSSTTQTVDGIAPQTFTVNYQILSTLGATTDASNPDLASLSSAQILSVSDVTSFTAAPAWVFRDAGAAVISGNNTALFGSAIAEENGTTSAYIQFQTYKEGTTAITGLPSFRIIPDLAYYTNLFGSGASDAITQEASPPNHTGSPSALAFTPNQGSDNGWSFAWNDTVTVGGNTYDQVEFAMYSATGAALLANPVTFQTDGNTQAIQVDAATILGVSVEILVFSDNTSTTVVEFNSSGAEIASIFIPATTEVDHVANLGDGRIALTYPETVDASGTTQYVTDIYDLRTTGLSIIDSSLSDGKDKYVAGTQFNDTFTGENNVNNTYYYVGQNTTIGSGPTDVFTGGTGGWNTAIFPDDAVNYKITPSGSSYLIQNIGDPVHSGQLVVNANVEALAFHPAQDPGSGSGGSLTVTGDTLVLLQTYSGLVTFGSPVGTLVLEHPSASTQIGGISGSGDILDLTGFDTGAAVNYSGSASAGTLTVSEAGHTTVQLTVSGTNMGSFVTAGLDSNGTGLLVHDPPADSGVAVIDTGATFDVAGPSAQSVNFSNTTGTTGNLVLSDASNYSGQISGFTGTAPDAAHSDTIDVVGINYDSAQFSETYTASTGLLSVSDGSNSASFTFDNFGGTLDFASDGSGGTLITDPPSTAPINAEGTISFAGGSSTDTYSESSTSEGNNYVGNFSLDPATVSNGNVSVGYEFDLANDQIKPSPGETLTQSYSVSIADAQNPASNMNQTASVSIGGPGNDTFVFHPGTGADTITNFSPQQDTIELDHFANVQTVQELQALITTDVHGDAVINLGHNDSITVAGVIEAQLQQVIQAGHVLLH
jgi:hypothetical protein